MACIFCSIVEGSIPSRKVYEDEQVLAFHDIEPQAATHVLIIPKKHIASVNDAEPEDLPVIGRIHQAAQTIARELNLDRNGYRLITNCGKNAGQVVFHLHYHLLGGEKLGPLNAQS